MYQSPLGLLVGTLPLKVQLQRKLRRQRQRLLQFLCVRKYIFLWRLGKLMRTPRHMKGIFHTPHLMFGRLHQPEPLRLLSRQRQQRPPHLPARLHARCHQRLRLQIIHGTQ